MGKQITQFELLTREMVEQFQIILPSYTNLLKGRFAREEQEEGTLVINSNAQAIARHIAEEIKKYLEH